MKLSILVKDIVLLWLNTAAKSHKSLATHEDS